MLWIALRILGHYVLDVTVYCQIRCEQLIHITNWWLQRDDYTAELHGRTKWTVTTHTIFYWDPQPFFHNSVQTWNENLRYSRYYYASFAPLPVSGFNDMTLVKDAKIRYVCKMNGWVSSEKYYHQVFPKYVMYRDVFNFDASLYHLLASSFTKEEGHYKPKQFLACASIRARCIIFSTNGCIALLSLIPYNMFMIDF